MTEKVTYPCPQCIGGWLYPPNGKPVKCHRCGGSGTITIKGGKE